MVLLSHIAKAAGVSVSTASRALAGREYVAAETRDIVKRAAAELGYEPNLLARGLRRSRFNLIGMLLPDTRSSSFSSEASQLLHRQLRNYGYSLLSGAYHHNREIERSYLETIPKIGLAGLFHKPLGSASAEQVATGKNPMPVVEFLRASGSTKLDGVVHDDAQGSVAVVEHLTGIGHRRIGLIAGPKRLGSTVQRVTGFLRALDFACIDRDSCVIRNSEHTVEGGGRAFAYLMAQTPRPTAIYASGAQLALGAALAADEAGVSIPQELSLVGLGTPSWTRLMKPRLTTYALPVQEIAMTAALLMVSRIENDNEDDAPEPVQITISGRLKIQDSTAPPAV
ncbi:MAG: LacI family transcriptional regulator [Propionibacteriaceae bacterium]|nr:LacI family transcriptional regulator [Propionibacteriaceae bacterium]